MGSSLSVAHTETCLREDALCGYFQSQSENQMVTSETASLYLEYLIAGRWVEVRTTQSLRKEGKCLLHKEIKRIIQNKDTHRRMILLHKTFRIELNIRTVKCEWLQ